MTRRLVALDVRLFVFLTMALMLLPIAARADDVGPRADLRAIRSALPVLLAKRLESLSLDRSDFRTNDVVVGGDEAVASWSDTGTVGIVALARRSDLWWLTAERATRSERGGGVGWFVFAPGDFSTIPCRREGIDKADLVKGLDLAPPLAAIARQQLDGIVSAAVVSPSPNPSPGPPFIGGGFSCDPPFVSVLPDYTDHFGAQLWPRDPLTTLVFHGRAPTVAEMPPTPGSNGYYYFYMTNMSPAAVRFKAGAIVDVWCPFVLDANLNYTLTLAFSDPTIMPLRGTLKDNVLYFALPAFTAPAGTEMIGEIDGNTF